ncbi:peptidase C15 [Xanthobacter autotrophicus]|uniref:pyroglutamyl-peptidase I family protein n=1 Tax=Xanthobacter autotrophicus TaxID=280 RepID=UPI001E31C69B|nr:peptidase C15 [Xanthobacter autotrophicus]UDQ90780.1 peptidase C15 [Xanthobacter autotrophicus]
MNRPLRILVCAFGSFPGVPVNPSQQLAADLLRLRRPALCGIQIALEVLPTRWDALARLDARLDAFDPDAVLLLGVAARRRRVSIEMLAVNATRAAPDAARRHPTARRLAADGPPLLRSHVPAGPQANALRRAGIAALPSRDAGRYLCNASYFHALAWAARQGGHPRPVLFVHLPRREGRPAGVSRTRMGSGLSSILLALAAGARRPV